MDCIRKATIQDVSRLAEILIFTKRMHYREIFHNDKVSFGEMQVYPLAQDYIANPEKLENIWVYDDGFVKGMFHIEGRELIELY
ncbi:MAG: GNAT family N-acetyltransferase, partial [Lachnospiraceae bacterium]|nr:GNAT family N-acetyltransferase [Lachnospiraceae bacterium]